MNKLPILTFHSIDRSGSVISMPPLDFVRMMQGLARDGWRGCTVSQALSEWEVSSRDQRLFGLSFDDGYHSLLDEALPVLGDLGFSATVFVIVSRCGQDNRWPGQASWVPTMELLDWADLEVLQGAGWEIGSHGSNHLPLTAVAPHQAAREIEHAKGLLERRLSASARLFAYPYGAYDETVRGLVEDHHEAACGVRLALASRADVNDRYQLPRIDAHYLRRFPASSAIGSTAGTAYLALRRWAAGFRSPHWEGAGLHQDED